MARRKEVAETVRPARKRPGPLVLVVDDNPITLRLVQLTLETEGYRVALAEDGRSALEEVAAHPPDLILQDLHLPDIDGLELVRRLRALPEASSIPILAYSGYLTKMEQARSMAVGFTDYVFKPIEPSRLIATIRTYLPHRAPPMRKTRKIPPCVLAVDDDPFQLRLLQAQLQHEGYRVVTADNGTDALAEARKLRPDAIVSDVLMPGLDGFRLCVNVREDASLASVPLVLISAVYTEEEDIRLSEAAGANAFVVRSPENREVLAALRRALQEPQVKQRSKTDLPLDQYSRRVVRQLEHQATLNITLSNRAAWLEAELAVLAGLADSLHSMGTNKEALSALLQRCLDALGLSRGVFFLIEEDGRLQPRAQVGYRPATASQMASGFFGHAQILQDALERGDPISVPSEQVPVSEARSLLRKAKARAIIIVPLMLGAQRLGVICLASNRELQEDWLPFGRAMGGHISHALGLARAVEHLAEKEERLERIVETVPDGIVILDTGGVVNFANPTAERVLGLSLVGERLPFPLEAAADQEVERPDGSQVTLAVNAAPLRDTRGTDMGTVVSFSDVTERRRAAERLRASLLEKEVLLKEVHHRVKNNLQVVSSLLYLQSRQFQETGLQRVFEDSQNRVRAMALVHERLYRSSDLTQIDFGDYLRTLATEMLRSHGVRPGAVQLKIRVDSLMLDLESAIPCGLIVHELLSNSLKHAFPDERRGEIRIGLECVDGDVALAVADDGVGVAADFDPERSPSLGLQLVSDLVHRQLKGRLAVNRLAQGAEFRVIFKGRARTSDG